MVQCTENRYRWLPAEKVYSMLVYIYGRNGPEPYGEIVNYYLKDSVIFQNTGELILKLEDICNRLDADAACEERRQSLAESAGVSGNLQSYMESLEGGVSILLEHGRQWPSPQAVRAKALLAVDIENRYHASLQGKVRGSLTSWRYVGFRSGLELMHIFQKPADLDIRV